MAIFHRRSLPVLDDRSVDKQCNLDAVVVVSVAVSVVVSAPVTDDDRRFWRSDENDDESQADVRTRRDYDAVAFPDALVLNDDDDYSREYL